MTVLADIARSTVERAMRRFRTSRRRRGLRRPFGTRARQALSALLLLAAVVLAVTPAAATSGAVLAPVLVTTRDIAPGSVLAAEDLRVASTPPELVPAGALRDPADAVGRMLAGAAREGEPLTDVRLLAGGMDGLGAAGAAVPIRLADAAVADLLHPGSKVDVVTVDQHSGDRRVLAADATVLTVTAPPQGRAAGTAARLVVISVPADIATRVAAVSLNQPVAVTLR